MDLMIHTSSFLLPSISFDLNYSLVVLNRNLPRFTPLMWNHARLRVCADGGANRLYDEMPPRFPDQDATAIRLRYKPDVITGDLDSIRHEVMHFYSELGTRIIDEHHNQDTTDLHKCIAFITSSEDNSNVCELIKAHKSHIFFICLTHFLQLCILVVGALGGRFDHEIGNINVLCHFPTLQIVLLSDDCLIRLLPHTHRHEIHIEPSVEGPHCGLIPIGTESHSTTTSGLRWDLDGMGMKFGGMLSTSNMVKGDRVEVESDADLLWTISIQQNQL